MKQFVKKLIVSALATCALFGAAVQVSAQTTVQVDSTKTWVGYMNVYNLTGGTQGSYLWGSGWGVGALTAYFNGTNSVTLIPNTNCYNPADPYWTNPDGSPNKWMEANFYVDVGTAYAGQTVIFTGNVLTQTLVSPYTSLAFIKEFGPGYTYVGMTTATLSSGASFSVTRGIAAGNICQYGFITTGPDANPATVNTLGLVEIAVNNADPTISTMNSLALVEGQNATFSVTAQGTAPLSYQWTFADYYGNTNVLSNGGRISGATSNSLSITGVLPSDAGTYSVTVTNSKGTNFAIGTLTVVPVTQAATNYLINPGFEQGIFAGSGNAGWFNFSGCAYASTNDFYYLSDVHVSVVEGTNACQIYAGTTWNGIYQDRPASPGQVFTADAWFLTSTNDPITVSNVCYLEVQFRDAGGIPLVQYSTSMVDTNFPTDTWINLVPTNIHAGDFITPLGTAPYLIAPAGTVSVRYQFTYHADGGTGSAYVDKASLVLREPVLSASLSGPNIQLSFDTLYGPSYQVYYKDNLSDSTWNTLGLPVTGDGTVKSVTDTAGASGRFYIVNTVQ